MSGAQNSPPIGVPDPTTETVVMAFIEMIQEHKARGYRELEATWDIVSKWLSNRSGLAVGPRHVGSLTAAMAEAGLITVGGGGIGLPNRYDITEQTMGAKRFWDQVDAFLTVWRHPSRGSMAGA